MIEGSAPAVSAPAAPRVRRTVWKHLSPATLFGGLFRHRELIRQLAWREVQTRYRGSFLGFLWAFLLPFGMLIVYTFVFGTVLQARWGGAEDSKVQFALTLFAGIAVFQVFSELMNSSCNAISQNVNFVKKVVFPLEVMPVVQLLAILLRAAISVAILLVGIAIFFRHIPVSVIYFPLILVPLVMLSIGLAWFLASLGVFIRDIGQFMGVVVNVLFFLTPIFYPVERLPERLKWMAHINPLAFIVENSRRTLIWNEPPQWGVLIGVTLVSAIVMQLGYAWFMETKRGFADVL